jgi:hypothetical protein
MCHREVGIESLSTRGRLLKPNPLQQDLLTEAFGTSLVAGCASALLETGPR